MLTGTPLDLTPLGEIFRWIGKQLEEEMLS
jgi:hypothetical protein